MFMRLINVFTVISFIISLTATAQTVRRDNGKFVEKKNDFLEKIKSESEEYLSDEEETEKIFILDFDKIELPKSKDEFKSHWHNPPISQGKSGMCWCFSTTSFYESEIFRLHGKKIKLSELHTVYYEYVEKACRFVRERGNSLFAQGSMGNHIPFLWENYGVVPASDYSGLKEGQPFHDHDKMFEEMESYLKYIKTNNIWDEEAVLNNIKSILNYHLGSPPKTILVNKKKMTPVEYFKKVVKINFNDYINLLSLLQQAPYNRFVEYPVEDNWWRSEDYFNIELDKFMKVIKNAIHKGYTLSIGGDTSEPGYYSYKEAAVVPTFDIPAEYIDEHSRQFRFSNESTTDDHGIHLVGYMEKDGKDWYLIKDSGSGSRNGANKGFYFYHEDYVKLKIMDVNLHKDALKGILE